MTSISLSTYTIRIYSLLDHCYINLNELLDGNSDSFRAMKTCIRILSSSYSHDTSVKKLFKIQEFESKHRHINGIIETGDYGYESDLFDIQSAQISYRRQLYEAELLPFYFHIVLPKKIDFGILILQRFGQRGIKAIFSEELDNYFSGRFPDHRIEFEPLIPNKLLEEYLSNGDIKSIKFTSFLIPSDIADQFDGTFMPEQGIVEYSIRTRRNAKIPLMNRVIKVISGNIPLTNFMELRNFNYTNVKIQIEINGKRRTIDLEDPYNLKSYYDVTDKIQIGEDGHPNYDSINREAQELSKFILDGLGVSYSYN